MQSLDVHAPPFRRNPSAWSQRLPIVGLALIAAGIALYMALYQWRVIDDVWDPVFGDGSRRVLDSHESEQMRKWMRVPDSALGAFAYLTEAIFGLAGSTRRWQYRPWLVLLFGFDVIPLGVVSVVLVFVQGMQIGSWCFLCLVTAVLSVVLMILAYDEVWASILFLRRVWKSTRSTSILWQTFWGHATHQADRVALERS